MNYKPNSKTLDNIMDQVRRCDIAPYKLMQIAVLSLIDELEGLDENEAKGLISDKYERIKEKI